MLAFLFYKYYIRPEHIRSKVAHSERYQNRINKLNANKMEKGNIVFIGNSLTEYFDLTIFNMPQVVNQGIAGDFSVGVLKRLDPILEAKPAKIFLMIGINDLLAGISVEEVLNNYQRIIEKMAKGSPSSRIYIQSVLPTSFDDGTFTDNSIINEYIVELNTRLVELTIKFDLQFIDLHRHFLVEKALNPEFTDDGVHLNEKGYLLWTELVSEQVQGN